MNGESRKKFDTWFRKLLLDQHPDYPRPKMFKLAKNQLFPDKGTVFDFVYDKKNNGTWIQWIDYAEKGAGQYPPTAKVCSTPKVCIHISFQRWGEVIDKIIM